MKITDAAADNATKLVGLGYALTHVYEDGAIRMAKRIGDVSVGVFVDTDGEVLPSHTYETHLADTELREAGLILKREKVAAVSA